MTETTLPATTQSTPEKREVALLKALGMDKLAPEERELALAIASRYSLDPMLRHMVTIEGKPVITRDGLLHVAHRSGQFDGISVSPPTLDGAYLRCEATVWRKDMAHPFVYPGRFPAAGRGRGPGGTYNEEMAIKVAESMALRRAFDVAAPSAEERWALQAEAEAAEAPPEGQTLADIARAKAEALRAAPPPAQNAPQAEEGVFVDVDATPEPVAAPDPALCGAVAEDGLMAGAVCTLAPHTSGPHKAEGGSWPR